MNKSIFYVKNVASGERSFSEEESKHCTQVLRHQIGDEVIVFDGVGGKYHSVLTQVSKKSCQFDVISSEIEPKKLFSIHLAISPTKSTDRMEWMIEKLCEIGVDKVSFIQTYHSERRKLRIDRMERKVVSAMKQSGNPFKMELCEMVNFKELIETCNSDERLIAHVNPNYQHLSELLSINKSTMILIGPEGDFSKDELSLAVENKFIPVSLGMNVLRTETAGLVACCAVNLINRN